MLENSKKNSKKWLILNFYYTSKAILALNLVQIILSHNLLQYEYSQLLEK